MDEYTRGVVDGMELAMMLIRDERRQKVAHPRTPVAPCPLETAIRTASDRIRLGVASLP
jgi:hypothetical protein